MDVEKKKFTRASTKVGMDVPRNVFHFATTFSFAHFCCMSVCTTSSTTKHTTGRILTTAGLSLQPTTQQFLLMWIFLIFLIFILTDFAFPLCKSLVDIAAGCNGRFWTPIHLVGLIFLTVWWRYDCFLKFHFFWFYITSLWGGFPWPASSYTLQFHPLHVSKHYST